MENSGGIQGNITAGLAGRYASALFDLARESNAIDSVQKSLAVLRNALVESADLKALVSSPVIGRLVTTAFSIGVVIVILGWRPCLFVIMLSEIMWMCSHSGDSRYFHVSPIII